MNILLALLLQTPQLPPTPPPPRQPIFLRAETIQQIGEALVQGVVTQTATGEAVKDASVRINTTGMVDPKTATVMRQATELTTTTDAQGKFEFRNLPFNAYTLTISKEGFFASSPNDAPVSSVQRPVRVDALQKSLTIPVNLDPGGLISGRVRDSLGDAVVGTLVGAMRLTYRNGHRSLSPVKFASTDDKGEFRLTGLPPGEYYVRAEANPTAVPMDADSSIAFRSFGSRVPAGAGVRSGLAGSLSMTYAPGTVAPERAISLRVRGGDELRADIETPKTANVRISGKTISAVDGSAQSPLGFLLMPRNAYFPDDTMSALLNNVAADKSDGAFEILTARPGSYDLIALTAFNSRTTESWGTIVRPGFLSGRLPIEVGDKDIDGLTISLDKGHNLELRFRSLLSGANVAGVGYILRSRDALDATPLVWDTGRITNPDGRLYHTLTLSSNVTFANLPEGEYQVEIPTKPDNTYVADMKQGGRSIYTDGVITVGRTTEPIEVLFSAGSATISGKIQAPQNAAAAPTQVTLVPVGARHGNPLFYARTVSQDGSFKLNGIAPGEYRLYAFDALPTTADEDTAFMSDYEASGRSVSLKEGSAITDIVLPLIRRAR